MCIWEKPTRAAISYWSKSLKNRSRMTSRSSSGRAATRPGKASRSSGSSLAPAAAIRSPSDTSPSSPTGWSRDTSRRLPAAASPPGPPPPLSQAARPARWWWVSGPGAGAVRRPPAGVAQVPLELADHTGHRVGDEWVAVGGVVAVDGGDQPGPGALAQVLRSGPAAVAVAAGQPVGHTQVGQDDLLAQLGIAAGGVGLQPLLDLGRGSLVIGADVQDGIVGKLGRVADTGHLVGLVVHEG